VARTQARCKSERKINWSLGGFRARSRRTATLPETCNAAHKVAPLADASRLRRLRDQTGAGARQEFCLKEHHSVNGTRLLEEESWK
jgi:hypothetical protein